MHWYFINRQSFYYLVYTDSSPNTIFLVYNEAGDEQLGLTVGYDIVLLYNGMETQEEYKSQVKFNTTVNDGRWVKKINKYVLTILPSEFQVGRWINYTIIYRYGYIL